VAVLAAEERRMRRLPDHRSRRRTLERLAESPLLFEGPGAEPGAWDRFAIRNIGLAVERETARRYGGDSRRMARRAAARLSAALGVEVSGPLVTAVSLVDDLPRWSDGEKSAAAAMIRAKENAAESKYLMRMQQHKRLRAAWLKLGSPAGDKSGGQ
jgi:hypothetical protein